MITATKSAALFHASLRSLREAAWKAAGNVGDAGPGSATSGRGHCFLPSLSSSSSVSSQHGLQPGSNPQSLPSSQTPQLPQKLLWKALPAHRWTRASHRHTLQQQGMLCPARASSKAQQKPAARCPHRCLADLQPKKGLHSPLHFLCKHHLVPAFPRFRPLLGKWCSDKSKSVTSGDMVTDMQIQSSQVDMCQGVKLLQAAARILGEGQGICQQTWGN